MPVTIHWLDPHEGFPDGGSEFRVQYRIGTQSSSGHLPRIGATLSSLLPCPEVFPGSLNLWADEPVTFTDPLRVRLGTETWLFVPVVIEDKAPGIAARRPPPESHEFIEVFACDKVSEALAISPNAYVSMRMLSGRWLTVAP